MPMQRPLLRSLLRALIAERSDAQSLYIPRGEAGQRRMIRALLQMRVPRSPDPLEEAIAAFHALCSGAQTESSAAPISVPSSSERTRGEP